jgi:hypothetical protein
MLLLWLDLMEEHRDLSLEEWNHLGNLLEQARIYWKQRGAIK